MNRENEEKYRAILENIEDCYYEVDLDGRFTLFNAPLCKLSGCSPEELPGMNYWQFLDEQTVKDVFQIFHKVYITGEPARVFDWQMIRKDKTKRYVEASATLIKDATGQPAGFRGIIRDITERKQVALQRDLAVENLQKSERYFKEITENSSDVIIIVDQDGSIKYCSLSVERFTGYKPEELIGKSAFSLIHPDDLHRAVEDYRLAHRADKNTLNTNSFRIVHKNGQIIHLSGLGRNLLDNPDVAGFVMNVRDVTERMRAEEAALKEYNFNHSVLDSLTVPFFMVDYLNRCFFRWNKTFSVASGYSDEEIARMRPSDLVPASEHGHLFSMMEEFINAGHVSFEMSLVSKAGVTIPYLCSGSRLIYDGKPYVVGIGIDLSKRKQAEELLKKSEARYRLLADHMKDYVWLMDLNLKMQYVSPSAAKLLGYEQEEFSKLPFSKFLTEASLKAAMDFYAEEMPKALAASPSYTLERLLVLECLHKDGSSLWIEDTFSFIRNENGKPLYILGEGREITERVKAEQALEKSEERYRSVFENAGAPMMIMEDTQIIFMINDRFAQMSGYGKDEIEGKMKFSDFIAQAENNALTEFFPRGKEDKPVEYECRIVRRNGDLSDVLVRMGHIPGVGQFIASFTDITARKQAEIALLENQQQLQQENIRLRSSIRERYRFCDIIGKSQVMQEVYEFILQAAATQAHVIIYGESGTGKELVAKAIHETGERNRNRFVTVHCGAIPETLMESEFFGYKKGAFTGANTDKTGYLDEADGGTLFLDEAGEIGLAMQVKLLRAIAGGGYTPVGSSTVKQADVRIIAATNRNLRELVKQGIMREDFFYRIHILPINLAPLRDRKEDLPLLVDHFLQLYDKNHPPLPANIIEALLNYDWPGNIRELQNVLHRYLTLKRLDFADGPSIRPVYQKETLPQVEQPVGKSLAPETATAGLAQPAPEFYPLQTEEESLMKLKILEKNHIMKVLSEYQWHRGKTASALGISRKTLFLKMRKFGLVNS
ncbi:MAG: PAS domain S-box protein [Syntrophaceae bacterium]|jgi:PAS domain S-box-containing protein|nr:PAS domain S-box protein [Syntrophaceae bacterium]